MRLRNIPGAREAVETSSLVVHEPEKNRGRWRAFLGKEAPLFVEIGSGKGKFLMEMAAAHPENWYLGVEMYSTVLYKALQRVENTHIAVSNFAFVRYDATEIDRLFAPGEVDGIYLNFSDPWPKDRHAHRRLTSDRFLARYENILAPGGRLEFKTDNKELFAYSKDMLAARDWTVLACTEDLSETLTECKSNAGKAHVEEGMTSGANAAQNAQDTQDEVAQIHDALLAENIRSEYEEKFAAAGHPICKLIATPPRPQTVGTG